MGGEMALTFEFMWSVLAFSFGMTFTPGPNCAIAFSIGLNYGFLSAVPFMLGAASGIPLLIAAVAWGLREFLAVFPEFYSYIRYVGIGYIFYLSWKIAASPVQGTPAQGENEDAGRSSAPTRRPSYLNGALFQWVNPKAWLLALTGVATYLGRDIHSVKLLFLCVSFSVMCFLSLVTYSIGGKLSGRFVRSVRVRRAINLFMGLLLASSVLTLF